jgi:SIR2-like domain/TIR domain
VERAETASPDQPGGSPPERPADQLKIFINYRHGDVPFAASALYRELAERYGGENVFFDGGTPRPGMGFLEDMKPQQSRGARVFIALIGPGWLPDMTGLQQRSDEDYVAREIELALRNGWTIIPLVVNDADLPKKSQLPRAIRALSDWLAEPLRQARLANDIEHLRARLDAIRDGENGGIDTREDADTRGVRIAEADDTGYPDVPPADDEHYAMVFDELDNLVVFLGADANADDREGPFRAGASLPDDTELAEYLAAKARLGPGGRNLAEVAQYGQVTRGKPRVLTWVREVLGVDAEPGPVRTYLARLPRRLEELQLGKRYQMIVSPTFDASLESAFRKEGEPFDVAVYMAPGTEHAGRFVHLPWAEAGARSIMTPNEYDGFPIRDDGELARTVIVKINGTVEDSIMGYQWKGNYVITEDDYIDLLAGRSAEEVIPVQILAKLRQASCAFLGYPMADWRLRVFLHWIWPGERPSGAMQWAVERDPGTVERRFWQRSGTALYRSRLTDYVAGFDRFLVENRGELA